MKSISLSLIAFLLSVVAILAAPDPPSEVVYKPTFLTGYDSVTAGTGFVLHFGSSYVFVTAHHLFGPAAGLEKDLTPEEAKDFTAALAAIAMDNRSHVLMSTNMLLIPAAKAFLQTDSSKDVAAFLLPEYTGKAFSTAKQVPKPGETIYLYARPRGEDELKFISGKVIKNSITGLEYFYDDDKHNFAGTSGAPVLNEAGEIVGINLGGGESNGRKFGFANPVQSFGPLILEAIKPGTNQIPTAQRPRL